MSSSSVTASTVTNSAGSSAPEDTAVIVGCGFSGIGAAILLKQKVKDLNLIIYEKQNGIGGTWWSAARYPGAACDVPSHFYSFSFARNPYWSHHFSKQGEIQQYLENVVNEYNIRPYIQFNRSVTDCYWNEDEHLWYVTTRSVTCDNNTLALSVPESKDGVHIQKCRYLIMSNAPLCEPNFPNVRGRELFQGNQFHSARWPKNFNPEGKRIAVVGTGASAAQFVPVLGKTAKELIVFQRTPAWVVPRLDFAYPRILQYLFAFIPGLSWLYRVLLYFYHDVRYYGFVRKLPVISWLNTSLALIYLKLTVKNQEKRALLTPSYSLGCKRIILSDDLYPALDRTNVTLVGGSVKEITADGIIGSNNIEHKVDTIVYATGFDIEASVKFTNVTGQKNTVLKDIWETEGGSEAYLGMTIPSFPNFFLSMGPNTGLGHSSVISMIEAELQYTVKMIEHMRRYRIIAATVKKEACNDFNRKIQSDLLGTVWQNCRSWYNLQGTKNVTMWPWTVSWYWYMCSNVNWNHYSTVKENT